MRRLFIILNCLFLCVHLFSLPVLAEQDGEGDGQDPAEVQTEVIDSEQDEETEPEPITSIDSDGTFDLAEAVSEDDESDFTEEPIPEDNEGQMVSSDDADDVSADASNSDVYAEQADEPADTETVNEVPSEIISDEKGEDSPLSDTEIETTEESGELVMASGGSGSISDPYTNCTALSEAGNSITISWDEEPGIDLSASVKYYQLILSGQDEQIQGVVSLNLKEEKKVIIDQSSFKRRVWNKKVLAGTYPAVLKVVYVDSEVCYKLGSITFDEGFDATKKPLPAGAVVRNVDKEDPSKGIEITCDSSEACSAYLQAVYNNQNCISTDLDVNDSLRVSFHNADSQNSIFTNNSDIFEIKKNGNLIEALKIKPEAISSLALSNGTYRVSVYSSDLFEYMTLSSENVIVASDKKSAPQVSVRFGDGRTPLEKKNTLILSSPDKAYLEQVRSFHYLKAGTASFVGSNGLFSTHPNKVKDHYEIELPDIRNLSLDYGDKFYLKIEAVGYEQKILDDQILTYPFRKVPDDLSIVILSEGITIYTAEETYLQEMEVSGILFKDQGVNTGNILYGTTSMDDVTLSPIRNAANGKKCRSLHIAYDYIARNSIDTGKNLWINRLEVGNYKEYTDPNRSYNITPMILYDRTINEKITGSEDPEELDELVGKLTNISVTSKNNISKDASSHGIEIVGEVSGALMTDNKGNIDRTELDSQNRDRITITTTISGLGKGAVDKMIQKAAGSSLKRTEVNFDLSIVKTNHTTGQNTRITQLPYNATITFKLPAAKLNTGESYLLLSDHNGSLLSYPVTVSGSTGTAYVSKFSSFALVISGKVQTADMYRMYNPNSGEHFYTGNPAERDHLISLGWNYEGVGFKAPKTSNTPMYRLYNPNAGDHHYTSSVAERDHLIKVGWNYEGIGWYADDKKEIPQYRLYNPNATGAGSHHYTWNTAERDHLISLGWKDEGIGFYTCR